VTTRNFKFGRKPRTFDSRIPKLTAARGIALPVAVNYATGMPANLSMLLNDTLGCCVESAQGHSEQVWTFNASVGRNMVTPSDAQIEAAYELEGGYVPGNPSTDNGTVIQVALVDWLSNAIDGNTLAAFVEVDVNNMQAIKESIYATGFSLIGFNVPADIDENPGAIWDYDPSANNSIIGGHCVICTGYQENGNLNLITWGSANYQMTPAFWTHFVDEAYALADTGWIQATGMTPGGLTLAQLEALMQSMKQPAVSPMRRHRHHRRVKRRQAK
jgi:hypothetical protein